MRKFRPQALKTCMKCQFHSKHAFGEVIQRPKFADHPLSTNDKVENIILKHSAIYPPITEPSSVTHYPPSKLIDHFILAFNLSSES